MKGGSGGAALSSSSSRTAAQRGAAPAMGSAGGAPVVLGVKKQRAFWLCRGPSPLASGLTRPRYAFAGQQHPIIIVPSSPTSLLTMWNIKRFLEDGVYVPPASPPSCSRAARLTTCLDDVARFESTQEAKRRANEEGIVKAEDLVVALRTGRGAYPRAALVMRTQYGADVSLLCSAWPQPS